MLLLDGILALFGRCRHRDIGLPVKTEGSRVPTALCRGCGRRIRYDWDGMQNSGVIPESSPEWRDWKTGRKEEEPDQFLKSSL